MLYETEVSIQAYRDYLIKSYDLIEEAIIAFQKESQILKWDNETEKEIINWFNYEINEQIIISWHSSALILIVSILEKSMNYILYVKYETRYRENHTMDPESALTKDEKEIIEADKKKRIENIKKVKKESPLISILYREIIDKDKALIEKPEIKTMLEEFIILNTLRNCYIHQYWYLDKEENKKILFQKVSKENLLEMCNKIYLFLSFLYNATNALDELEWSTLEEIENYIIDTYELDEKWNIV